MNQQKNHPTPHKWLGLHVQDHLKNISNYTAGWELAVTSNCHLKVQGLELACGTANNKQQAAARKAGDHLFQQNHALFAEWSSRFNRTMRHVNLLL